MHRDRPGAPSLPLALALALLAATSRADDAADPQRPIGVLPTSADGLAEAEGRALEVPNPKAARALLRRLTEEPHVAGTQAGRETAVFVLEKLREWGWSADIAEYEVLLNEPKGVPSVTILRPERRELKVTEDAYPPDKDSTSPDAWPAFHGYGVSGHVDGQVVYVNYGTAEDFEVLDKRGIDVEGKIVLARYGAIFRGLKVLNAQRRGAIGVLLYSDPLDDGYAQGDIYPHGPYRPPSAIQRGSVQFLSLGPGDPSTPNGPSVKGADRLPFHPTEGFPIRRFEEPDGFDDRSESEKRQFLLNSLVRTSNFDPSGPNLMGTDIDTIRRRYDANAWEEQTGLVRDDYFASIPSLPISFEAARPILSGIAGPNVPDGWQGGLPMAYHVGPGPVEVELNVQTSYAIKPIQNVIARLEGESEPDSWVMIGNHRDAWTYGAVDPSSGTAATLETCRALGAAYEAGWRPRRTIVYASWDAEEYGLVGSTEWADDHAEELDEKALLMLNVDSAVAGPDLDIQGTPSLRDLVLDAADDVRDPATGRPLGELWLEARRSEWAESTPLDLPDAWADDADGLANSPLPEFEPAIGDLGSGSDYTVFVDHLGVPALNVDFSGGYGVYHSIYDDYYWMDHFGDPGFALHATAAKLYALILMRAASAEVAPLTFVPYAEAMERHVDDLRSIVARKTLSATPDDEGPVRFEGLDDLVAAIREFSERAEALDEATADLADRETVDDDRLGRVNDAILRVERALLIDGGLPGRPFFRHAVYAPGLTTGYAAWPLPGLRQAIEEGDQTLLNEQLPILIERIEAATAALNEAEGLARDVGD